MNSAERMEILRAISAAQESPAVIRRLCIICKDVMTDWEAGKGYAMCGRCMSVCFPAPKVEQRREEPKATVFQLKDGKYAIIVDR